MKGHVMNDHINCLMNDKHYMIHYKFINKLQFESS